MIVYTAFCLKHGEQQHIDGKCQICKQEEMNDEE